MSQKYPILAAYLCACFALCSCNSNQERSPAAANTPATAATPATQPASNNLNDLKGLWLKGPVRSVAMTTYNNPSAAQLAWEAPDSNYRQPVHLEVLLFNPGGFLTSHTISASLNNTQATYLRFRTDSSFTNGVHMISTDHAGNPQPNTRVNYWKNPHEYYMTLFNGDMSAAFGFYFNDAGKQIKADQVVARGKEHQTNFVRIFEDKGATGYHFTEQNMLDNTADTVDVKYLRTDSYGNPVKVLETHTAAQKPDVLRFYVFDYYQAVP